MRKLVLGLLLLVPFAAWATIINPWNTNFDSGHPNSATVLGSIDDEIVDAKQSTRARVDVDHAYSSLNGTDTTNSGRHLPGSARAFIVNSDTACSGVTAMVNSALDASGTTIPEGTLCVDKADLELCIYSSGWQCSTPAPSGAIFMFETACPTGYTDISATHTKNVLRVIDTAGTDADIPDTPGTACTANGGECGAATTQYSDTLSTNEIPAHQHESTFSGSGGGVDGVADNGTSVGATDALPQSGGGSTGGGDPHYHPSSYFRLCKKN